MMQINFHPFPILETSRLKLRQVQMSDAEAMFQLRSNPETMKYVSRPLAENLDDAIAVIKMMEDKIESNEGINWAISLKGSTALIGVIGLYRIQQENYRSEIGYMLMPAFWGKGIITEAIPAVLTFGFQTLALHSVEAIIEPENVASEKVLYKNGFVKEAHFIENEFFNGKFISTAVYSILKRNFNQGQ